MINEPLCGYYGEATMVVPHQGRPKVRFVPDIPVSRVVAQLFHNAAQMGASVGGDWATWATAISFHIDQVRGPIDVAVCIGDTIATIAMNAHVAMRAYFGEQKASTKASPRVAIGTMVCVHGNPASQPCGNCKAESVASVQFGPAHTEGFEVRTEPPKPTVLALPRQPGDSIEQRALHPRMSILTHKPKRIRIHLQLDKDVTEGGYTYAIEGEHECGHQRRANKIADECQTLKDENTALHARLSRLERENERLRGTPVLIRPRGR